MRIKKFFFFTIFSIFSICFLNAANSTLNKILYISSENAKTNGIQYSMIEKALPLSCQIFYLPLQQNISSTESVLQDKKFDAVIVGNTDSYEFVLDYQQKYFEGIPIIVLGQNSKIQLERAKQPSSFYFIKDPDYISENIKLGTSLFPHRNNVIFVGSTEEQKEACITESKKYSFVYEFKNITEMTKEQIEQYFSQIEKCFVIFMLSPNDLSGREYSPSQILKTILDFTDNPVFVCHEIGMGQGVLGGYFTSTEKIASITARVLNVLFAYQKSTSLPSVNTLAQPGYYFDAKVMQKYKITRSDLDNSTTYINAPQMQNSQKNNGFLLLLMNIILITAVTTILLFARNSIELQRECLNEEREKLNAVISQSDALFWECYFGDDGENYSEEDEDIPSDSANIAQGWIDSGLIPQDYVDQYNQIIVDIKSGKESVSIDLPLLQKDTHTHLTNTRWKHIVYRAIKNHSGKGVRAIATATDITSQKRAEEEYEGEMSYRAFVNKEYPVYTRLNLTNNVVMERMVNVPELKMSVVDSSADNELALIVKTATVENQNLSLSAALNRKELLTSFLNGTRSRDWDFFYPSAGGMIRWYTLTVELSSNPYTSCVEANIYMREITNRKIMAIAKDSVLDEEVEYIFWLDMSNSKCNFIHKANNTNWIPTEENIDYHELVKTLLETVISPKDKETVENFFALKNLTLKLKDKSAANCTFEISTDNLRIAIKQMRSYYLNNNQNVILFICRDITDITLFEKLQNEKLSRAITQAEKANASKSDFLSRMSHDLRTPMNGIIGMTELAEDEIDHHDALREDLRKIKSSSKYMLGLLNDILDMAKIESGKLEIRKSKTSVGEVLESIITIAKTMCETNQINFQCNLVPADYMNAFVNIDRLHLQQVIMNLLSNASKFTPPHGDIKFLINILNQTEKDIDVEFIVSDTGSGMTKDFQKIMFEAFTQDVNSVNKVGTGLGLSIVNSLVGLMGGTIECDSAPGKGTKFTIKLTIENLGRIDEATQKATKDKSNADLTGKRILLVEDNPLNQEISRRVLQKKGMVVTLAENGQIALDTFSQSPENSFDLILMDVMMPVMGGIESASRIREIERDDAKNIPIIALTANAFTEDIQKCIDAGMNTHLSKPINPLLLIKTISEYIG